MTPEQHTKFELLGHGVHIPAETLSFITARLGPRPLTLADYASTSGVTLQLGDHVWINAPTREHNPNMVFDPLHDLLADTDQLILRHRKTGLELPVRFAPVPAYQGQKNEEGRPYTDYVNTHGDRARISPIQGCAMRCKFCDIPYEYKGNYQALAIDRLIESAARAFDDPVQPASHLLISGGTPGPRDYAYLKHMYRSVITAFKEKQIDIMMVPVPDIIDLDDLADAGVRELSLNLELWDRDVAARVIPEKARYSRESQLDFVAKAVDRLGKGRVRSILIVGLESIESTLEGVEALAGIGCVPVLSPFRPDPITELSAVPPPSVDVMVRAFEEASNISEKYGLSLGPHCIPCTHNTLTLADGTDKYYYHERHPATI
jgi:organic radical activating enzyme